MMNPDSWLIALGAAYSAGNHRDYFQDRVDKAQRSVLSTLSAMRISSDRYKRLKADAPTDVLLLFSAFEGLCDARKKVYQAYERLREEMRELEAAYQEVLCCNSACEAMLHLLSTRERRSYAPVPEIRPEIDEKIFERPEAFVKFWVRDGASTEELNWVQKHREKLYKAGFSDWSLYGMREWANERKLADSRRQGSSKKGEEKGAGTSRQRPTSYESFKEDAKPRFADRGEAHSSRAHSKPPATAFPSPMTPSSSLSKEELVMKWRQKCEPILQNEHALLDRFPNPPSGISGCARVGCTAFASTRALKSCCKHDLREIFALVKGFNPKRERLSWHPDRFSACKNAAEFQAKAKEIFYVVNEMLY